MKLIIREYLSLLKEDGELDKVLQDLLLMMNIRPISKPQKGVRQNGVDIAAVKNSEPPTLYLFVIKCGDIGRSDWDGSSPQSIRPSLDEIKDTYLLNNIQPEHKNYLKKIVVCTGGVFKQEIEQQYIGYAKTNEKQGVIEYEFWDGNKLAEQIMEYMLNENILAGEYQSPLRKTLALLGDPDYDLSDYYNILKLNFIETKYNKNKSQKAWRTINLILSIIFYWAKNADNLKPALYCAERTMLYLWEFMRKNESLNDKNALALLMQVYKTCIAIYNSYVLKFKDTCTIKDGLHGHSRYSILESINIFEQLGIFSLYGLMTMAFVNGECRELKEKFKIFIENHKSLLSPTFDNHIIDISLAAIFLTKHSEHDFLDNWISEMVSYIAYAYLNLGLYFPIVSDSIEDFISLESGAIPKEKLMTTSTLLATLIYLSALLRLNKSYSTLKEVTSQVFNKTSLQFWYPDETTDDFLYSSNAGFESGLSLQIEIAYDIETMRNRIIAEYKSYNKNINISSIEAKILLIPLISSRHFRTPILPYYFFEFIMDDDIEYRAGGDLGENVKGMGKVNKESPPETADRTFRR